VDWSYTVGPHDVAYTQIRGDLDPSKTRAERLGERADQEGLRQPGQPLEQDVASCEERDQEPANGFVLPDDPAINGGRDVFEELSPDSRGKRMSRDRRSKVHPAGELHHEGVFGMDAQERPRVSTEV